MDCSLVFTKRQTLFVEIFYYYLVMKFIVSDGLGMA